MAGRPPSRIPDILRALELSAGFISVAAEKLGIKYFALQKRIKRTPALQQALRDILEGQKDFTESRLLKCIKQDKGWAICFYLKCKAKDRDYVERPANNDPMFQKRDRLGEVLSAFRTGGIPRGHYIKPDGTLGRYDEKTEPKPSQ